MRSHARTTSNAIIAIVASIGAPAISETSPAAAAASAAVQGDAQAEPETPRGNEIIVTATKRAETIEELAVHRPAF